ncbi:MAG TPA: arsenate reductase (azurin) small subunit [Chloroflexi bacterium]|nr:arsenate reductase (azurin) small subunit [Chloroflexota bacterium]HHW87072.1 arsenate reductase (azurin) small subunit [Chloroflexota bacterium]
MHKQTVSRRGFLKLGGATAATVGLVAVTPQMAAAQEEVAAPNVALPYPDVDLTDLATAVTSEAPQYFSYPDDSSPCIMLKLGKPAPGGVGPDQDIVAYSVMCTHQGCPLNYDAQTGTLKCPCHYSIFDAELGGKMVIGSATVPVPQVELEYDEATGAVRATGLTGLLYGRVSNVL